MIRLFLGLGFFPGLFAAPAGAQAPEAPYPCVSCLVLELDRETAAALAPQEGAQVAVRTPATGDPGEIPPSASTLIVHGPLEGDADAQVFALRTFATDVRTRAPAIRVVLDAPTVPGVPLDRVASYFDAVIGAAESVGAARWRRAPALRAPTVRDLSIASLLTGGERIVVSVSGLDPTVLQAFLALRATAVEVTGARALTAEEIVARHQAVRRREDAHVQALIARGATTLMFEVPGFVAPVVVTARTTMYERDGVTDIEQQDVRVNGAAIAGGTADTPPQLPLIEPERIATPPLAITLNDAYRYERLDDGRTSAGEAYVVAFAPKEPRAGLAAGRAWIDRDDFALARLQVTQTGLRGAIVSSEHHVEYAPVRDGGTSVWLPTRTDIYQMYEGAGHRTPIHRRVDIDAYEINPPDFTSRHEAALASSSLMLRETPDGLRYLLRSRRADGAPAAREVSAGAGQQVRAAVLGVLIDPNISVPLPFAGLSYVDLNLFGTGTQFNAFFGGTYGQLSWSVPSVAGSRWQVQGRAFAIAVHYNDRAFRGGREQYAENIEQRPGHVSSGVVRPLTNRTRLRASYELDVTGFRPAESTSSRFAVPATATVHGLVIGTEGERGPWSARAWWNPARRQGWRAWGLDGGEPAVGGFQRYGVSVARTLALGSRVGARVEGAWMDGRGLDRFSRYSFNAFDNRLHGYPTASIRYDRGGVVRTVTSLMARGWRVDAFGDVAVVRDPGFGPAFRGYPGVGAALETAGLFRSLWSVEWGYGFRGIRADGGRGTQSVRVAMYRMF